MQKIKKFFSSFLIGMCCGILGFILVQKISEPFIDTKARSDYAAMNFLKNKIIDYKNKCGHYPNSNRGLSSLLVTNVEDCYPQSERLEAIPKNSEEKDFLYFSLENDFYIVNSLNEEMLVNSKTVFP